MAGSKGTVFSIIVLASVFAELTIVVNTLDDWGNCSEEANGCSVPLSDFPYKDLFTDACNHHDVCYYCATTFGWSKQDCDNAFKQHMQEICHIEYSKSSDISKEWPESPSKARSKRSIFQSIIGGVQSMGRHVMYGAEVAFSWVRLKTLKKGTIEHCLSGVDIYYEGVQGFADGHMNKEVTAWCKVHPCASKVRSLHVANLVKSRTDQSIEYILDSKNKKP